MNKTRQWLYETIFGTETKAGKLFDVVLLWTIIFSAVSVIFESIKSFEIEYHHLFNFTEWFITIIFTIEYVLRIYSHPKPLKYILSFWGLVDLASVLPNYISLFITGSHMILPIRLLRLLRVFRILKLGRYFQEAEEMLKALSRSSYKIIVFLLSMIFLVIILGSLMYVVEEGKGGFDSIPKSIYWAVITITTVGYGDIVPMTSLGKFIASFIMITGYSIIAVPTGIITAEFSRKKKQQGGIKCPRCKTVLEIKEVNYCYICGNDFEKDTKNS